MGFTHFDENGKAVMVDVTAKSETEREATGSKPWVLRILMKTAKRLWWM